MKAELTVWLLCGLGWLLLALLTLNRVAALLGAALGGI